MNANNTSNATQNSLIANKKDSMDKRDLARLLDYYRMRVGNHRFIYFISIFN